jgi:hypothetical protein
MIIVWVTLGLIPVLLVGLRIKKLRRDANRFVRPSSPATIEVRPTIRVIGSGMPPLPSTELRRPSIDTSKDYVFGENGESISSFPSLSSPREKWAIARSAKRSRWPRGSAKILGFALAVVAVLLVAGTLLAQR